jgi:hypothetical protein
MKKVNGVMFEDFPMAILASSEEEACGIALKNAHENLLPDSDGYYSHKAQAIKVPSGRMKNSVVLRRSSKS